MSSRLVVRPVDLPGVHLTVPESAQTLADHVLDLVSCADGPVVLDFSCTGAMTTAFGNALFAAILSRLTDSEMKTAMRIVPANGTQREVLRRSLAAAQEELSANQP